MRCLASLIILASFCSLPGLSQQSPTTAAPAASTDPLAPLDFRLGTWSAKTNAARSADAQVIGTYKFARDLAGHALARTGSLDKCTAPQSFDCQHHDQLTIFADPNGQTAHHASLFALYLDNEGHVIYYTITTPEPHTVVFMSQSAPGAPHDKLTYRLEGQGAAAVMTGKFQGAAPGSDEHHSYLEWGLARSSSGGWRLFAS